MSQVNLFLHGRSLYEKCVLDLELVRCGECTGTGKQVGKRNTDFETCSACKGTGMNKNPATHYKGKELSRGKT